MRAVIAGAGNVGSALASQMLEDGFDVVVVERDGDVVKDLSYEYDLLAVEGNGASASALDEAGVRDADLFVAATGNSELNVMACTYVRSVSGADTIARVHDAEYISMWEDEPGAFGVDHMLYPELMAAERIANILEVSEARDVGRFAGGEITLVEFVAREGALTGSSLRILDVPEGSLVAAIVRNGEVVIPGGGTEFAEGDRVVVLGSSEGVSRFGERFGVFGLPADLVTVVGASEVGEHLVDLLLSRDVEVKVIEEDEGMAKSFAERFPDCLVLRGGGTDLDVLDSENIGDSDAVVSVTESDEKNLMSSLLGKRLGAEDSVAKVEDPRYVELFEAMGVDAAVNPHRVTMERMLRITRGGNLADIRVLDEGQAEIMELEVAAGSGLIGVPLSEAGFPEGCLLGAVLRDGEVEVPMGDFELRAGDRVVIFAEDRVAAEAEEMFG